VRAALARNASEHKDKSMKKFLYALIAMMSLGATVANASAFHNKASQQQGDAYNWLEGGGG
jgi:hypothetical protein